MLRFGIVLLTAAACVAAPVPKSLKRSPTLNGRWESVELRSSGNVFARDTTWVWDIDGETVTRHNKQRDGSLLPDGPAALTRPDAGRLDEVDYTLSPGNQPSLFRARVEVTRDELVINFANVNDPRPPDMAELPNGYLYRFKRVEK